MKSSGPVLAHMVHGTDSMGKLGVGEDDDVPCMCIHVRCFGIVAPLHNKKDQSLWLAWETCAKNTSHNTPHEQKHRKKLQSNDFCC